MIYVLTPTRGRPVLARRALESLVHASRGPILNVLYVDEDDPSLPQYRELLGWTGTVGTLLITGERCRVGRAWNVAWEWAQEHPSHTVQPQDLVMMGNDDLVWQTPEWDLQMAAAHADAFPHGIGLVWPNDLGPSPENRCCFPLVSAKWCWTVGQFTPEVFHFLWNDTWLHDVAVRAGVALYVPRVVVEHRHFSYGKAPFDPTYQAHRIGVAAQEKRAADREMYGRSSPARQQEADELKEAIRQWRA